MKYGKTKNFVVDVDVSAIDDEIHLTSFANVTLSLGNKDIHFYQNSCNSKLVKQQLFRLEAIETINQCISLKKYNDESFKTVVNTFNRKLHDYNCLAKDQYIQNILDDFSNDK